MYVYWWPIQKQRQNVVAPFPHLSQRGKKKTSDWVSVVTASHPWLPAPSGLIFHIISSARALIPLAFPPRRALEWVAAGCVYRTRRPLCGPMCPRLHRLHVLHPVCRLLRTLFCPRSATLTWVGFGFTVHQLTRTSQSIGCLSTALLSIRLQVVIR